MGKLRPREVGSLAQSHTAGKWQSWDLNWSLLVAELQLLGTSNHLTDTDAPSSYTGRQGEPIHGWWVRITVTMMTLGKQHICLCIPGPGRSSHLPKLA